MPFSFNESDYRNTFPGEVVESVLLPTPSDPTREMWQITILRLRYNAGKNDWEPLETPYPCQLPGCVIQSWHTHTRYYESDRAASPSHKFILSIQKNTDIALMGPQDLLHKRFTWEEEVWPSRPNPTTQTKGKDQYYYFIKSKLGNGPDAQGSSGHEEEAGELPWANAVSQPSQTAVAPTTATTNGTAPAVETKAALTVDEATLSLLPLIDGKTKPQIQQTILNNPELRGVPGFLAAFMTNKVRDSLTRDGFISEDEAGVWHLTITG